MAQRKKKCSPPELERIRAWLCGMSPDLLASDVQWLVCAYSGQAFRIEKAEETERKMAVFRKALDDAGFS